jgi:hypothetical protein
MHPGDVTRIVAAIISSGCVVASSVFFAAGLRNVPVATGTGLMWPGTDDTLCWCGGAFLLVGLMLGVAAVFGLLPSKHRGEDPRAADISA